MTIRLATVLSVPSFSGRSSFLFCGFVKLETLDEIQMIFFRDINLTRRRTGEARQSANTTSPYGCPYDDVENVDPQGINSIDLSDQLVEIKSKRYDSNDGGSNRRSDDPH